MVTKKENIKVAESQVVSSTPYDDVFRTLVNDGKELLIPMINEIFGEHYTGKEQVVFTPNEHLRNAQDGQEKKRITDSCFQIVGEEIKKYHLECQSNPDSSMLVRFFEYDTQIALDEGSIQKNILRVVFPHSAVLFLRSDENTPKKMYIEMVTPEGSIGYSIPVMQAKEYSLEEIFEKNLLFLLPFYIFSHEKQLSVYNKSKEGVSELAQEYVVIQNHLEELSKRGEITEYMKGLLYDMSAKVLESIARNYDKVRKGVQEIMRGQVLDYPTKDAYRAGIQEGRKAGIQEGQKCAAVTYARNLFLVDANFDMVRRCINDLSEEELKAVYQEVKGQEPNI